MLYKIVEGFVEVSTSCHPVPRPEHHANRWNTMHFTTLDPKVDAYKFAFLTRTIVAWNTLPNNVVLADSVEAFLRRLYQTMLSSLIQWRRSFADSTKQCCPR